MVGKLKEAKIEYLREVVVKQFDVLKDAPWEVREAINKVAEYNFDELIKLTYPNPPFPAEVKVLV